MGKVREFFSKTYGKCIAIGTLCLAVTATFELARFCCSSVRAAGSSICISRSSVEAAADSVARILDDTMRLDLGENISDLVIEEHRNNLALNEIVPPAVWAKTRPVFIKDSALLARMHQKWKYRR